MTTNGVGEQAESTSDTAGQTGHDTEVPETTSDVNTENVEDQDDHDDQGDVDSDQDSATRRNREKHYRQRAQAAEAERDQLREQLDTLHRDIVTDIANGEGLPEAIDGGDDVPALELLKTAGYELASFITDEGKVDRAKVIEATTATMRRYNIRKRGRLEPNPQQGAHGVPRASGGVAGVIKGALGR